MPGRAARFSPSIPPTTFGVLDRALDRFADLAAGLERAATAIARLDARLAGHPLAAAWLWADPDRGLRLLEKEWFAARSAVRDRRRDSRAAAAVDIMAAAPLVSATSLAGSLEIAVKNAVALLDAFVARGIAIEVTHRSKRRLYGLKHPAPLREEAAPPRRPVPGRGRGRPPRGANGPVIAAEYSESRATPALLADRPALTPIERQEFDFTDLDRWMLEADRAIRRTKALLDQLAAQPSPPASDAA